MKRLLIDLDGTLYRGDAAIDGAAEFIRGLQQKGTGFLLLTNCPLHSPALLGEKLKKMGISVPVEQILSSGSACAEYIGERYPGKTVMAVGSESFVGLIGESGVKLCRGETGFADVVAVGHTTRLSFSQLSRAAACIRNGADFLAANLDPVIPHGKGFVPHTGALAAYLEAASGKAPIVVGKPFPYLLEAALKRLGCEKRDCVMIGDGLDTDFAFAKNNGIDVRIVLSGVTNRETALEKGVPQEKLCRTLAEIRVE